MALCPIPTVVVWSLCPPVLWERIPWSDCPEMWRGNRSCYRITWLQYHSFLFKFRINVTFTSCYLFGRNMCCLSIHKCFGWHRLWFWPHYFGPFLPLKPEEVIIGLGALKRERETNVNTQLQDYITMHFCLSLVLTYIYKLLPVWVKFRSPEYPQVVWMVLCPIPTDVVGSFCPLVLW